MKGNKLSIINYPFNLESANISKICSRRFEIDFIFKSLKKCPSFSANCEIPKIASRIWISRMTMAVVSHETRNPALERGAVHRYDRPTCSQCILVLSCMWCSEHLYWTQTAGLYVRRRAPWYGFCISIFTRSVWKGTWMNSSELIHYNNRTYLQALVCLILLYSYFIRYLRQTVQPHNKKKKKLKYNWVQGKSIKVLTQWYWNFLSVC